VIHGACIPLQEHERENWLKKTPTTHLHLETHLFATRWSGNIMRGIYEGHVVAAKVAMVCSGHAEVSLFIAFVGMYLCERFKMYSYELT
jgi:hypothetical protein